MWKTNTIEQEIDRIRLEIYEEIKNLTPAQRAERTNRIAEAAAKKYGFKIVASADEKATRILTIRGKRVMLDVDLAEMYGVSVQALNQAVERNAVRFPNDFMLRLMPEEAINGCRYAFTAEGVVMLSTVLNSKEAIQINVAIIRSIPAEDFDFYISP